MRPKIEEMRVLTAGRARHAWPAVSAGGGWVAHVVGEGDGAEIVLTDGDGRFARVVGGSGDGARQSPTFANERLLYFCEQIRGRVVITRLDVESGRREEALRHPEADLAGPAVDARRGRLVFSGAVARRGGEVLLETDLGAGAAAAGAVEKVTEREGQIERRPACAPDGERVAFEALAKPGAKESALGVFHVKRRRTDIVAVEPGGAYVRPGFLDPGRVVFGREAGDGTREMLVCDVESKRVAPVEVAMPAREPSPFRRGGALWLAWSGQPSIEGRRADPAAPWHICVGRLTGL